jgi:oxygen-independent coproporphyrinogen III oxidase
MPGLYLHIPFCKQACHYCDFHFSTTMSGRAELLKAMEKEIALRKDYLGTNELTSVYLGGGTPSLLTEEELSSLFNAVTKHFTIAAGAEITLEANPDDLDEKNLRELDASPVNRLSIGVQSFSEEDLRYMNRAHNVEQALACIKKAQQLGMENISIDLIYGTPTMNEEQWNKNLSTAISLNVPHISAYCLTVEPKTALADFIKKGKSKPVDEEIASQHFLTLIDTLQANGFIQYEISNFGKPGFFAIHNSSYWLGDKYLGIGPSAHSFDGTSRQWNIANNTRYTECISKEEPLIEKEILTPSQRFNERIMTSLRTIWGVDLNAIQRDFGEEALKQLEVLLTPYEEQELLVRKKNKVHLTLAGKLLADKIASDLFITK